MPSLDGARLHEHHGGAPVPPASGQGDPKQSVARLEVRAFGRAFHRRQLLPQRQVLQYQFAMAAERQRQRTADHHEQLQHGSIVADVASRIKEEEFWRGAGGPEKSHSEGENLKNLQRASIFLEPTCAVYKGAETAATELNPKRTVSKVQWI